MIHRSHGYSITDYHQSSKASGYKNPLSPNPHKTERFDLKRSNSEKISHLRSGKLPLPLGESLVFFLRTAVTGGKPPALGLLPHGMEL